jgi:hypothetical protein
MGATPVTIDESTVRRMFDVVDQAYPDRVREDVEDVMDTLWRFDRRS